MGPYRNSYNVGYLTVKLQNEWFRETLAEKCFLNGYGYRTVDELPC